MGCIFAKSRFFIWFFIFIVYDLCQLNHAIADDKVTSSTNQAAPQSIKIHPLAENLAKIGAFSCAERANQIGYFLAGNVQPEIIIQTPKDNPNSRLLMSTLIIPVQSKEASIGSISLAPNQVNGCGGSYHAVTYSDQSCAKVIEKSYKNIKFQAINRTNIQIGVINRALWMLAMPADKGCVLIKEEVIE